ncbi:peptidylprolyl isomerase [Vibrio sonorensis]|uniref:peptidylprolyl isomerase n=1 Tax=Vibrio sonorensis TaxID=1004316 RepID=UPI0008D95430|nr:peptidylprolyl isomerase [Vibrio sonorensis]
MMERLREGVNSIAVKIILGLIILSFVFTGVSGYIFGGAGNTAAKVGNIEIGRAEFEQAYQNERNRRQSQLGDYFANLLGDPAYVEQFRKSVLDRMINDALLEQHAQSLGLRVSDAQVRTLILEMPEFQVDGKFDQDVYQATLRRAGFSAETFADYLRRDLVRNQLLSAVQASDFTLPGEVDAQSKLITQTRDIRKIVLPLQEFEAKVELSEEEINAFYQENTVRFTRPEQAKVSYIELSAQQLRDGITISDEQAERFYQDNIAKYSTEEQRKVSHILVQGDDQAQAQAILDELSGGVDFAELAQEKSQDIGSAEEGGSLGWIERDVMDPAFEDAAFALEKVGDTTGLVKSEFGYHIIKLDELKASVAKPYDEVAQSIKDELKDQQAVDKFYELQNELETVAFEFPDSLDDAAQAIDGKIQHTDFISEVDAPAVLKQPAVYQAILSPEVKEDGLNSEVIEVAPEHVIVVRVEEVRDETVLPLEEVRSDVVAQLSKVKAEQTALTLAQTLVTELGEGNKTELNAQNLTFGELEKIDRGSPLADVVFAMAKPQAGNLGYAQAKEFNGDVVVVELVGVTETVNDQYKAQIGQQLTMINAQLDLEGLIGVLRNNTEIEYYVVSQ